MGGSHYKLMVIHYALGQGGEHPSVAPQPGRAGPGLNVNERAGPSKRTHQPGRNFAGPENFSPCTVTSNVKPA